MNAAYLREAQHYANAALTRRGYPVLNASQVEALADDFLSDIDDESGQPIPEWRGMLEDLRDRLLLDQSLIALAIGFCGLAHGRTLKDRALYPVAVMPRDSLPAFVTRAHVAILNTLAAAAPGYSLSRVQSNRALMVRDGSVFGVALSEYEAAALGWLEIR